MSEKYCIIPKCGNTSKKNPEKIFFVVPTNNIQRKKWFYEIGKAFNIYYRQTGTNLHCCQDHFDFNFDFNKQEEMGVEKLILNKDAYPHIFTIKKKEPGEVPNLGIPNKKRKATSRQGNENYGTSKPPDCPQDADEMPKRELLPAKGRPLSRRAASKEALKQMHLILDDEAETLEIPDDDDDIPLEFSAPSPPKKKYKITHRKSSDGGDREVLVFKSITNHNVENTLDLECWPEDLSPEQLARNNAINKEEQEMKKQIEGLLKNANAEVIFKGEYTTAVDVSEQIQKTLQALKQQKSATPVVLNSGVNMPPQGYQLVLDPRLGLIMTPTTSSSPPPASATPKVYQGKVHVAQNLQATTSSTPVRTVRTRRGVVTTPLARSAASPVQQTSKISTPVHQTGKNATPVHQTGKNATPVQQSNKNSTPVQSNKNSTPVQQTSKNSPLVQQANKNATPISTVGRVTRGAQISSPITKIHTKCEVVGCTKPRQPFHPFPSEENHRIHWIEACGNPELYTATDLQNRKVCHKHFSDTFILRYDRLAKTAIPSLHIPSKPRNEPTPSSNKMSTRRDVQITDNVAPLQSVGNLKPSEGNVEGGLTTGTKNASKSIVDLTGSSADCREISFNKLQGKTYPSLVVVARPHLRAADQNVDRHKLDTKVKAVLMHAPTKFTEWLIQQGLVRSEQKCSIHPNNQLKLGMYSDVSKFPYSGGYVWISECCPQRFVSVFSGSLFEGSPHPPMVILKLLYHWSCQTNIQNVTQWVKVDNLYVKGMYTWLRSICTAAVHTHVRKLGGPGTKVEVGVISLGTTSQDGVQRQVKVEVLGILETTSKLIRLRAVEPLADGDKNYRKRFLKILEPILQWVHPSSTIVTDLTVDRTTLNSMGFHHVIQNTNNEFSCNNRSIMEYLRRIVPRMFQNTLSLLSRQIIQQFLDELVWREWFGTTACQAFDHLIKHLSEQTRHESNQTLLVRLNKISLSPFKNWSLNVTTPPTPPPPIPTPKPVEQKPKGRPRKPDTPKTVNVTVDLSRPPKSSSPDIPEQLVPLENYYYGTIDHYSTCSKVVLNIKCPYCKEVFTNNLQLMNHLFKHAHNVSMDAQLCRYCLTSVPTANDILKHFVTAHPCETKFDNGFVCLICETHYMNPFILGKHMSKEHSPSELPYQCGTCSYRCSNHKQIIDHFYKAHDNGSTIQCPFCLKSTTIFSSSRNIVQNVNFFIQHLQKHQKKQFAKRCGKCNLWFINKDDVKEHQVTMHCSQRGKNGLIPWSAPRNGVMVPKSKMEKYPGDAEIINFSTLFFNVSNNSLCKECTTPMNSAKHFPSFESCQNPNCQYSTCCTNAMQEHNAKCSKQTEVVAAPEPLPCEMFCVCGFSSDDGNILAKHLAICERKSAYPTMDCAKQARVTHSMLDVLGLVRKPDETVTDKKKIQTKSELVEDKVVPTKVEKISIDQNDILETVKIKEPEKTKKKSLRTKPKAQTSEIHETPKNIVLVESEKVEIAEKTDAARPKRTLYKKTTKAKENMTAEPSDVIDNKILKLKPSEKSITEPLENCVAEESTPINNDTEESAIVKEITTEDSATVEENISDEAKKESISENVEESTAEKSLAEHKTVTEEPVSLEESTTEESAAMEKTITEESAEMEKSIPEESVEMEESSREESAAVDESETEESADVGESVTEDNRVPEENAAVDESITEENAAVEESITEEDAAVEESETKESAAVGESVTEEFVAEDDKVPEENAAVEESITEESAAVEVNEESIPIEEKESEEFTPKKDCTDKTVCDPVEETTKKEENIVEETSKEKVIAEETVVDDISKEADSASINNIEVDSMISLDDGNLNKPSEVEKSTVEAMEVDESETLPKEAPSSGECVMETD